MLNRHPFADLHPTPANHFRLYFYAAVSQMLAAAAARLGSTDRLNDRVPGMAGYAAELSDCGVPSVGAHQAQAWWREAIAKWERRAPGFLPIRAVRDAAALDHDAITLVFAAGLLEEDARFGALSEFLNDAPGQQRATVGLLTECWADAGERGDVRRRIRDLLDVGLLHPINSDAPRLQRALEVPVAVWDALRGDAHERPVPWARFIAPAALAALDDLILPASLLKDALQVPALLDAGEVRTVIVRGPQHNGRRTLIGAMARKRGRGVLELTGFTKPDDERWRQVGVLATALHALPVVLCEPGPGETFDLPRLRAYDGSVGVVIGRSGGLSGPGAERALTFTLGMPDPDARREHWRRGFGTRPAGDLDAIAERFRLTAGHIRRAAGLADSYAALDRRSSITAADVQQAARALNRESLDSLATHVVASGDWSHLAARDETFRELVDLERRCRHRERLLASVRGRPSLQSNCGVRALFRGPSGTGKTLAARLLASVLQMDLYRLDLSSVVNKYIGETEKNLDRVLSRAEELDVMLLLDEGDALLTQRTSVQSSNDRYANLETNYLLQRLESFEGILIVTTNAGDRIDSAFERRMDVAIDFHPLQAAERWEIWQTQLPATHVVDAEFLSEVATRCALSGGQIRNAVLHACLLSLDGDGVVTAALIDAAIRREYRKAGAVCPLRAAPFTFTAV